MTGTPAKVLVVDDEWVIRQQLTRALDAVGIANDCAVDGEDALDKIVRHHYELIVTDLRMPERHGHSLAVSLLSHPKRPRIVALTGVTDPRVTEDLLARGVDEVIYKPVNYFRLADRLKVLLGPPAQRSSSHAGPSAEVDGREAAPRRRTLKERVHRERDELEARWYQCPPRNAWITTSMRWIDPAAFSNPPAAIKELVRRLYRSAVQQEQRTAGMRAEPAAVGEVHTTGERVPMNAVAIAIPLGGKLEPLGTPFKLVIRSLGRNDIALVHTERLDGYIAVMWRARKKTRVIVLADVMRCQRLDAYYDIEAKIVT